MTEEKATLSKREQQIQEMEEYISQLEKLIEQKRQVEDLLHNKAFNDLILEDYCKKEVVRYLKLAVLEELPAQARDESLAMAEDAVKLKIFLDNVSRFGAIAERDISEARKALAQLESEKDD